MSTQPLPKKQNAPKEKAPKSPKGPPMPRQPYARINFLYQVSMLLSLPCTTQTASTPSTSTQSSTPTPTPLNPALSRFYLSILRSIAQKNVLKIHPNIKRSICKRCEVHLVPGVSCTLECENRSRGGRKAWAEVLVVRCGGCGAAKRFPVGRGKKGKGKGGKEEMGKEREGEGV
ncbi:RNAse P Rpr2/Rpp21/SNM1 subunit domain-containing protein, partial [Tirmania nivea]